MLRRTAAAIGSTVAALAFCITPASAATVNWKPVNTNANWHCTDYVKHPAYANVWGGVNLKACIVKGTTVGAKAQGVLVVQNKAQQNVFIESGQVITKGGNVACAASNLAAGATAGCYAPSFVMARCGSTGLAETWLTLLGRSYEHYHGVLATPC